MRAIRKFDGLVSAPETSSLVQRKQLLGSRQGDQLDKTWTSRRACECRPGNLGWGRFGAGGWPRPSSLQRRRFIRQGLDVRCLRRPRCGVGDSGRRGRVRQKETTNAPGARPRLARALADQVIRDQLTRKGHGSQGSGRERACQFLAAPDEVLGSHGILQKSGVCHVRLKLAVRGWIPSAGGSGPCWIPRPASEVSDGADAHWLEGPLVTRHAFRRRASTAAHPTSANAPGAGTVKPLVMVPASGLPVVPVRITKPPRSGS